MIPTRNFDLLERFTHQFPGRNVLSEKMGGQWKFYTSEEYSRIAHQFACGLLELGFGRGDKIMTVTNNRPQWNFVDMGMSMAGLVHVPVYTSMNEEEYAYIMDHSDARAVMVSDQKLYDLIKPVFAKQNKARYLFTIIPVCHVGGRLGNYQTQYSGACIYYAENMGAIAANLKEIKATGFDAVPRILEKIYDNVIARGRSLTGMKRKLYFLAVELAMKYKPQ